MSFSNLSNLSGQNSNFFTSIENRLKQENIIASLSEKSHSRSSTPRANRPTNLLSPRNRAASPACNSHGFIRSSSQTLSPSPSSINKYDVDFNTNKNGVFEYGNQTIKVKMEDIKLEHSLGSGTCSDVYFARHVKYTDFVMAVKQMRKSSNSQEENRRIVKDLSVVTQCNHSPFIVKCLGILITREEVWICMEVMSTCLDKLLKRLSQPFPEYVAGKVAVSIIHALNYLKEKHCVMHRDVKPSNMLLSSHGVIKLCDFGISGKLKDSVARSRQLGCIGYMAPERLDRSNYDVRADVWSLGISLVELCTGEFPYKGVQGEFAVMSKIISDPAPTLPAEVDFSDAFRSFINMCLQKDYRQRFKYIHLMHLEFFQRHNSNPMDIHQWYEEQQKLNPALRQAVSLSMPQKVSNNSSNTLINHAYTSSTSCSSGYASTASDSSPGSLGSQSRSPSTIGIAASGNDNQAPTENTTSSSMTGCLPVCFSSKGQQQLDTSTGAQTIQNLSKIYPRVVESDILRSNSTMSTQNTARKSSLPHRFRNMSPFRDSPIHPGNSASVVHGSTATLVPQNYSSTSNISLQSNKQRHPKPQIFYQSAQSTPDGTPHRRLPPVPADVAPFNIHHACSMGSQQYRPPSRGKPSRHAVDDLPLRPPDIRDLKISARRYRSPSQPPVLSRAHLTLDTDV